MNHISTIYFQFTRHTYMSLICNTGSYITYLISIYIIIISSEYFESIIILS